MSESAAPVDARRAALLVLDVQPLALGSLTEPEGVLYSVGRAASAVRRAGGLVVYVRTAFTEHEIGRFPQSNKLAGSVDAYRSALLTDSPSTAIDGAVAPLKGDLIIRKTRTGAFSTSDLDAQLRQRDVDTVILSGVRTSGVVLSAVREAADLDYRVLVLGDATADADPLIHEFLLTSIFPQQADVLAVEDLPGRLSARE